MFRIELLPAAHGDAVWIEYGDPDRPRRVVIDGGPAPTYEQGLRRRILHAPADDRRIDLFVVTHIDADHIDGAIILLQEARALGVELGEIWFNGWPQLATPGADRSARPDTFDATQGEFLGALLRKCGVPEEWNGPSRAAIMVGDQQGPLPSYKLPEGARLTLLSPGASQLQRLRARWASALRDFSPGDSGEAERRLAQRREVPVRPRRHPSSAFAARATIAPSRTVRASPSSSSTEGVSAMFAADAHPRVLTASLRRLALMKTPAGGPVRLDAIKLPHHGSFGNISQDLIAAVDCHRWLISTNGDKFGHPHRETAALIASRATIPPVFFCNYKSALTKDFARSDGGSSGPCWETRYPDEGADAGPVGGVCIDLSTGA